MGQNGNEVNRRRRSVRAAFRRIFRASARPLGHQLQLHWANLHRHRSVKLTGRPDRRIARFFLDSRTGRLWAADGGGKPVRPAMIEPRERAPTRPSQGRNVLRQKREPERKHPEAENRQNAQAPAQDQEYAKCAPSACRADATSGSLPALARAAGAGAFSAAAHVSRGQCNRTRSSPSESLWPLAAPRNSPSRWTGTVGWENDVDSRQQAVTVMSVRGENGVISLVPPFRTRRDALAAKRPTFCATDRRRSSNAVSSRCPRRRGGGARRAPLCRAGADSADDPQDSATRNRGERQVGFRLRHQPAGRRIRPFHRRWQHLSCPGRERPRQTEFDSLARADAALAAGRRARRFRTAHSARGQRRLRFSAYLRRHVLDAFA